MQNDQVHFPRCREGDKSADGELQYKLNLNQSVKVVGSGSIHRSGFRPANIGQVRGRNNFIERVVVDRIRFSLKLRVRSIHSLMDAKFVEKRAIRGIQLSAAVILWVRVVIRAVEAYSVFHFGEKASVRN